MNPPRDLLAGATQRLAAAGVASPRADAEWLLAGVLQVPRGRLALIEDVPAEAADGFERVVARRERREPLQHILRTAAFRLLELAVGPGVFVPRPETELLVDAVLPHLLRQRQPVAVDLCAGSGALALSIATEAPHATVVAVEREPAALEWLRLNALHTPVTVVEGDVGDPHLLARWHGRVDALVSNPPYVPTSAVVPPEVLADPRAAVFAGPDGLALIPSVLARGADLLKSGGTLAIEHDESHAECVPDLLERDGHWRGVADHRDLAGRPRFATALRA